MNKEYHNGTKVLIKLLSYELVHCSLAYICSHTFACIYLLAYICLHIFACIHLLAYIHSFICHVSDAIDAQ